MARRARERYSAPARALARFWTALIVLLGGGAALLQWLGPPPAPPPVPHLSAAQAALSFAPPPAAQTGAIPEQKSRPIPPPDPALLEPSPENPKVSLPRIGAGGLTSIKAYAAAFNTTDPRARIGLIVAGLGLSEQESQTAVENLPGAVTFAFSPYAPDPTKLLARARSKGHEILISLPLEPEGYPLNDAGDESLLVGAPPGQNLRRLDWALSRIEGYVGATGALEGMLGQRFAAEPDLLATLERRLAERGLLYVDPRAGKPDPGWVTGRTVDVVVDQPAVEPVIKANLQKLESIAREHGSAVGLIGWPGPRTLEVLGDWINSLPASDFVLTPITVLVHPPAHKEAKP